MTIIHRVKNSFDFRRCAAEDAIIEQKYEKAAEIGKRFFIFF